MQSRLTHLILSVLALMVFAAPCVAHAESPPNLSEMWLFTPKDGASEAFMKGFREHIAFRAESGDPRAWETYTPMLGENLGQVAVRYCCFKWDDQDAYLQWGADNVEVFNHYNEHVAPHVEEVGHYFSAWDWPNSHWDTEGGPYKYFAVTEFNLKPEGVADFDAARDKMSQIAINQGWAASGHSWAWSTTIGGKQRESIVIPYRTLGDMDRGEDSFAAFLAKKMGSAEKVAELMHQFASASWSTEFQIWVLQESLSMSVSD